MPNKNPQLYLGSCSNKPGAMKGGQKLPRTLIPPVSGKEKKALAFLDFLNDFFSWCESIIAFVEGVPHIPPTFFNPGS
jgi:hypothetical protein